MGASVFTLLSVEFGDDMRMVYLGGLLLVGAAMGAEKHARECGEEDAAHLLVAQAAMGVRLNPRPIITSAYSKLIPKAP
jgi:hypothetical protein